MERNRDRWLRSFRAVSADGRFFELQEWQLVANYESCLDPGKVHAIDTLKEIRCDGGTVRYVRKGSYVLYPHSVEHDRIADLDGIELTSDATDAP